MTADRLTGETVYIDSYRELAVRWWCDRVPPHGRLCPCLPCADLRRWLGVEPLPIRVGSAVFPAFDPSGRRR